MRCTYSVYVDGNESGKVYVIGCRELRYVSTSTVLRASDFAYPIRSICKEMFFSCQKSFYDGDFSILLFSCY